jgi:hypothetical protein
MAGSAYAAPVTLLNDTFEDGGRTNGADANDTAWFNHQSGSQTITVGPDAGINTGNAMLITPTSSRGVLGTFARTTLADGDNLTLTFDMRILSDPVPTSDNRFRFSLLDSKETYLTADASGNTFTTDGDVNTGLPRDEGYGARFDNGPAVSGGDSSLLYSSHSRLQLGDTLDSTADTAYLLDDNAKNTFVLSVTRSGDTNLLSMTLNGGTALTGTHVAGGAIPVTFTFDEVMIGLQGTPIFNYALDNVNVTYTAAVPEPAGLALLGLGSVLVLRRRRSA